MMPVAGAHYPRTTGEFLAWFRTDEDCLDYLEWLRWPDGFICPGCGHAGGWRLGDGRIKCGGCGARASLTAGTIFDKTRTPLTVWFHACWLFATAKDGISAQHLQRSLEIGRCRMAPLADASAVTLTEFISQNVEPGSTVITDGWSAYPAITGHGYAHKPVNQKAARAAGADPGE